MSRILTIIIIVLALGGAGLLGYRMLFPGTVTSPITTSSAQANAILPFGTKLDFEQVKKYNKDGRTYPYPVVNSSEVGPDLGAITQ